MSPRVSILIPCYNVEKYLRQCLDSVVGQSLPDIEIIVINDGSTDSTPDIIREYAARDNRIKIIDKPNTGYGNSMNCGLDAATGEYIGIVESDDWVDSNMFETLTRIADENRADIAKADFVFFDNDSGTESKSWDIGLSPEKYNTPICPRENPAIIWNGHPSIWTCIYRTSWSRQNNIRFPETPGASFQDMGFKLKTFIAAARFIYTPSVLLHYRKHGNNSDLNNNKPFAICAVHDDADAWARGRSDLSEIRPLMNQSRLANYIWNLNRLTGDARRDFRGRFKNELSLIINHAYIDMRAWLRLRAQLAPYNPLWRVARTALVIVSPIYRNRIRNGQKVNLWFGVEI